MPKVCQGRYRFPCSPLLLAPPQTLTLQTHERELGSIQPINSFGPNTGVLGGGSGGSGGGGGPGGQGSMEDKARARDLLRADVSPMEIDSSVTFDSIGGGKVTSFVDNSFLV